VPTSADPPPCAWPRDAEATGNAAVAATSHRLVIRTLQLLEYMLAILLQVLGAA
jgi:hypothetical protein